MKKLIFPALVAGLFAVSCSKKETKSETPAVADSLQTEQVADSTASTTEKLSFTGNYEGKIPCADCPGIETKLTLNDDKTFVLESNYLEKKDGKITDKGSFEVSPDGEFITLKEEMTPRVFHLTEDAVYLVEKVGDKSLKAEYKLSKK